MTYRECFWCGVRLRWWQYTRCRICGHALSRNDPSPPVPYMSRKGANQ